MNYVTILRIAAIVKEIFPWGYITQSSPKYEVKKKLAAYMPLEYVFLLPLLFPTVLTAQKSDDAQLVRKSYICKSDSFGSAVAVF